MMKSEKKPGQVSADELIKLHKAVEELKAENNSLRKEKSETDKRINTIEEQLKLLLKAKRLEN